MKKMILASCILAAAVFAAPDAAATAAKADSAQKELDKATAEKAAPAAEQAAPAAEAAAPAAEQAAPAAEAAAAPAEAAPAAEQAAPAAEAAPAEQAAAEAAPAEEAPAAEADFAEPAAAEEKVAAADKQKPAKKKKRRKKKKMIQNAVLETPKLAFDINADFELEAGKVFWTSEDDEYSDNLETWNGEANFAVLAEGEDFKGKIAVAFYPGDLKDEGYATKAAKKEAFRNGQNGHEDDYFSLDEAWALQETDLFSFKVGRWDNTDKNGDYFGGYIDGYLTGFMSTQASENQLQFGFTPSETMDMFVSFISQSANLNKGDLRAVFNFHNLEALNNMKIQLGYRSNIFDVVYDSDAEIQHNVSLKVNVPLISSLSLFGEVALMNLSADDDMVMPITGGIAVETPVVDRIILEAEYVGDRYEHPEFVSGGKHVKDVLGAIYLEKAFTDRFSLSAGFHSFGSTKDWMLSGNLVGRIN
jgi:hypothetical protein